MPHGSLGATMIFRSVAVEWRRARSKGDTRCVYALIVEHEAVGNHLTRSLVTGSLP
jgi:hypothetical protein